MLEGCVPWPEDLARRYVAAGCWEGKTLGDLIDESAAKYGPREAVAGPDGVRYTYNDVKRLSDRLALHFLKMGLQPQDRVIVQLLNVAEFVPLYFGLAKAALIPVMALPPHRLHEIGFFAELTEARGYILPAHVKSFDYSELAKQVQQKAPSVQHIIYHGGELSPGATSLKSLLADPIEERVPLSRLAEVRPDPNEAALFLLSGGTTGLPKLIPRTHNDYIYNSRTVLDVANFKEAAYLAILPIEHNYPIVYGLQPCIMEGSKFVLSQTTEMDQVMDLVEREKITHFPAVPSLYLRFMNHPSFKQRDLGSLRLLITGAQRLQPDLKPKIEEAFGAHLQEVLGMAEGLLATSKITDPPEMRYETCGVPISPFDEIRIVDDNGQDVPEGKMGELIVRGPTTLRGYYKAPEHNRIAFDSEGYYHSGDIVRRGPHGGIIVEGRKKDMINRGGEHLSAEEIENLILLHDAIHNAAVIGMPDPEMGERICAYIIPKSGQAITCEELNRFLLSKDIAKFKLPERLEIVNEFPLTNVGKVSKKDLREDIARKLAKEKPAK